MQEFRKPQTRSQDKRLFYQTLRRTSLPLGWPQKQRRQLRRSAALSISFWKKQGIPTRRARELALRSLSPLDRTQLTPSLRMTPLSSFGSIPPTLPRRWRVKATRQFYLNERNALASASR